MSDHLRRDDAAREVESAARHSTAQIRLTVFSRDVYEPSDVRSSEPLPAISSRPRADADALICITPLQGSCLSETLQDTFLLVDGLAAASSTWEQAPPRMQVRSNMLVCAWWMVRSAMQPSSPFSVRADVWRSAAALASLPHRWHSCCCSAAYVRSASL